MESSIFIVGTPIGNMEDITLRAIDTLRSVDIILAEDTRRTRKLLNRHGIHARMLSCHRFNEAARIRQVIDYIKTGLRVALVTNAGMPGISDPGNRLAAACRDHGINISVVPGPSSVTAAVALSGFGGGRFLFEGFLPRGMSARQKRLTELRAMSYPVVLFVSPYRCFRLLTELENIFGDRMIFAAREMTKLNEECIFGSSAEVREALARGDGPHASDKTVKGEITLVLAPASKDEIKLQSTENP